MDEARAVIDRLERIAELERREAGPEELLAELRALVADAERWAGREGDDAAAAATQRCRSALDDVTLTRPSQLPC